MVERKKNCQSKRFKLTCFVFLDPRYSFSVLFREACIPSFLYTVLFWAQALICKMMVITASSWWESNGIMPSGAKALRTVEGTPQPLNKCQLWLCYLHIYCVCVSVWWEWVSCYACAHAHVCAGLPECLVLNSIAFLIFKNFLQHLLLDHFY